MNEDSIVVKKAFTVLSNHAGLKTLLKQPASVITKVTKPITAYDGKYEFFYLVTVNFSIERGVNLSIPVKLFKWSRLQVLLTCCQECFLNAYPEEKIFLKVEN